jgi:hypothetical protein
MGLVNNVSLLSSSFVVPENAQFQGKKDGSRVYFWTGGGNSFWMTYNELADKNSWKYEYEYPEVPRFTFISAEEAKDGKSGKWWIYNPVAPHAEVWAYTWTVSSSNTFTAHLLWNEQAIESSFDVVANSDNSGTYKYFNGGVITADIAWSANGSGTYWMDDGGAGISGSWTAK